MRDRSIEGNSLNSWETPTVTKRPPICILMLVDSVAFCWSVTVKADEHHRRRSGRLLEVILRNGMPHKWAFTNDCFREGIEESRLSKL